MKNQKPIKQYKEWLKVQLTAGIFMVISILAPHFLCGQNAPVTTAGQVLSNGPGGIIPVTVSNFLNIGSLSLTFDVDNSVIQITGVSPNVNLPGFTADWTTTPGRIVMGWTGMAGITLPELSHLVDISFTGLTAGSTPVTWFDDGTSCLYTRYNNGSYTVLNDSPTATYYKNGSVTWQRPAPITTAPVYPALTGTNICIPVTVTQFENIGSISLTLTYNPSVLIFQSLNSTAVPGSWYFIHAVSTPGRLVVGGYGPGFSLTDGTILFNMCFAYLGGTSPLNWDDDGNSCEYADGTTLNPLFDEPQTTFYQNGVVSEPLTADFMADSLTPPTYSTVSFTDLSIGFPTSWEWSFSPTSVLFVDGTTSHSQNPHVQFTNGGPYTVTLIAQKPFFSDSEIKIGYIWAGTPGLWTGDVSTEWNADVENWDDHRIPTSLIDVLIPAGRPNYPVWKVTAPDGPDFIIGTQCKTITVQPGATVTVDGNVIVN